MKNLIKNTKKLVNYASMHFGQERMMRAISLYIALVFALAATGVSGQELSGTDEQLLIAANEGDTSRIDELISEGATVNAATYEGVTPLMLAAQNGHTAAVAKLISKGANVDARTTDGFTALILTVSAGYIQTAEVLIRNGANTDLADIRGVSPLMHAIQVDSFYLADLLLYYGADVNHKDNDNVDALMIACLNNRFEIAVKILESGADINSYDENGNTPLHYATSSRNELIMELLILNGADKDKKNNAGFTPLLVAVSVDYYRGALLLTSYGADVNTRIRPSVNALTIARNNMNDSLVRLLKNNGAIMLNRADFSLITVSADIAFNKDDSRLGAGIGLNDRRFYWMPSLSYSLRPAYLKVLDETDSAYFQYREIRHYIDLDLSRAFFIRRFNNGLTTAAYATIGGVFTFGSYKGSTNHPDARFLLKPGVGIMFEYQPIRVKMGYERLDLHLEHYNTNWFAISVQFLFNIKKRNVIPG